MFRFFAYKNESLGVFLDCFESDAYFFNFVTIFTRRLLMRKNKKK